MNIFDWYKKVITKDYANFSGRARRMEYWSFHLINYIVLILFAIIIFLTKDTFGDIVFIFFAMFIGIYIVATFIPSLAVLVRRLHDTGNSGWLILIALIPYLGGLILIVLGLLNSQKGYNKWGPNPKGEGNNNFPGNYPNQNYFPPSNPNSPQQFPNNNYPRNY